MKLRQPYPASMPSNSFEKPCATVFDFAAAGLPRPLHRGRFVDVEIDRGLPSEDSESPLGQRHSHAVTPEERAAGTSRSPGTGPSGRLQNCSCRGPKPCRSAAGLLGSAERSASSRDLHSGAATLHTWPQEPFDLLLRPVPSCAADHTDTPLAHRSPTESSFVRSSLISPRSILTSRREIFDLSAPLHGSGTASGHGQLDGCSSSTRTLGPTACRPIGPEPHYVSGTHGLALRAQVCGIILARLAEGGPARQKATAQPLRRRGRTRRSPSRRRWWSPGYPEKLPGLDEHLQRQVVKLNFHAPHLG